MSSYFKQYSIKCNKMKRFCHPMSNDLGGAIMKRFVKLISGYFDFNILKL